MYGRSTRSVLGSGAAVVMVSALGWMGSGIEAVPAQDARTVEFRRDVQPLLREHCVSCHGPTQQMGGLRLDQRGSVMKRYSGRLQPGSSTYSQIYQRLIGSGFGPPMPPAGALPAEDIQTVKNWIDQGATWPDDVAGDPPPPPVDVTATELMDLLREGQRQRFRSLLEKEPDAANLRGPGGATPLMFAALYGDSGDIHALLARGANPNIANEAGATALMWALADTEKTQVLLRAGADPNARAQQGQTPLAIAAGRAGSHEVVSLLLDRGATPSAAALAAAAGAGDEIVFRTLLDRGADLKSSAARALLPAMRAGCRPCVERLIGGVDKAALNAMLIMLAPFGKTRDLKMLLDHGADVNATLATSRPDFVGRTPLTLAASSDVLAMDAIKMLIARGADVNAKGPGGETPLDLARRNGRTPIVDLLIQSGARETHTLVTPTIAHKPAASIRSALERSLQLLQRSDAAFIEKTGCVSCHHNTLTAMTVAIARAKRLPVSESIAVKQRTTIVSLMESQRDTMLLAGGFVTNAASNILVGLAAERHAPDATTDALAYYLKSRQLANGSWRNWFVDHRPPIQGSDVEVTATSIRALDVYAPSPHRTIYETGIQRAAEWLMSVQPRTTDERAWQLLGLTWAGMAPTDGAIVRAGRALVGEQRADGGWAQLPSLASDAYATGQALVALHEAGVLAPKQEAYRRGVEFLLRTQVEDGSWYVKTRAIPFQPYFESGFPHGPDQWVSVAATNWASMALALALP